MFKTLDSETLIGICPFCSNSESFKFKEQGKWMFLCHDCQRYMPFDRTGVNEVNKGRSLNYNSLLSLCTKISDLPTNHRFRKYCEGRKIPLDEVYYTDKFDKLSEYADTPVKDKERLVIPFFTEEGDLFAVQGRSLEKEQIRYITLMFDKDRPKLFGLNKINQEETIIVVEGPIDSFFLKNSLAMAGSDGLPNKYKTNAIICFDNEPRSNEIVSKMRKSLEEGYRTVIWPDSIKEKDINDMVLSNLDVESIVVANAYSGMNGLLKLNMWKR